MAPILFTFGAFLALLLLYTPLRIIWDIFCHPLRLIPGPRLWVAFPSLRHLAAIRGRLDIQLCHFHEEYGEIVRFGPDEISFTTAQAWRDIYGYGHHQLPKLLGSDSDPSDIISANDADHRRYRKALSHAFSAKGLQAQEPLIARYVDQLVDCLKHVAELGLPTDMAKWYNLTTFDLIGDLTFGSPIFKSIRLLPIIRLQKRLPFSRTTSRLYF
ncbi:cytochrome P450 [Aspergillus alliaceus]|uniref:Cytochrome P450 n=1 Tax=Petromyces alliaceus TaxID=209559 RepID=A0A5N7C5U0_PETAA|nr:cytochrome P450 [Aspergillus alliaceus]